MEKSKDYLPKSSPISRLLKAAKARGVGRARKVLSHGRPGGNMPGHLPCGAGRVAALERPRRSIHSRSRSTPPIQVHQIEMPVQVGGHFYLVEARGVEPLSENASK